QTILVSCTGTVKNIARGFPRLIKRAVSVRSGTLRTQSATMLQDICLCNCVGALDVSYISRKLQPNSNITKSVHDPEGPQKSHVEPLLLSPGRYRCTRPR